MENLTEKIRKDWEAKNPERKKTDAEKKEDALFIKQCLCANPYTVKFFNVTRQIELSALAPETAAMLKEAAKWEGVDDLKANPGLAEGKGEKKGSEDDA